MTSHCWGVADIFDPFLLRKALRRLHHVHGRLPSFREKAECSSFVMRRQVYATHGCQDGVRR